MAACIDDLRTHIFTFGLKIVSVALVNVSMRHDAGMMFFDEMPETEKTAMRKILVVSQIKGGGVCKQDIYTLMTPKLEPKSADTLAHLLLCVLVRPLVVAHAAAQPQNSDAVMDIDGIFDTDTALGGILGIANVMVAMDVEDGRTGEAGEKGKVRSRQVSAGEHKFNTLKLTPVQFLPELWFRFISEQQDFHDWFPRW